VEKLLHTEYPSLKKESGKYKKKFKKFKNIDEDLNNKILNLDRQFLHAKQLGFDHPRIGERLEFSSNIPIELNDILKKLRKLSK